MVSEASICSRSSFSHASFVHLSSVSSRAELIPKAVAQLPLYTVLRLSREEASYWRVRKLFGGGDGGGDGGDGGCGDGEGGGGGGDGGGGDRGGGGAAPQLTTTSATAASPVKLLPRVYSKANDGE